MPMLVSSEAIEARLHKALETISRKQDQRAKIEHDLRELETMLTIYRLAMVAAPSNK